MKSALRTKKDVAGFYALSGIGLGILLGSIGAWMPAWYAVATVLMIGILVTVMVREWQWL